ncbi:MAG: UPF0182 family protein [Chroococcales cyanobacterium]
MTRLNIRAKQRHLNTPPQSRLIIVILLAIAIVLLGFSALVHLVTESWWFEAVNYSEVFWTLLTWRALFWITTFTIFFLFLWGNYRFALRFTQNRNFRLLEGTELELYAESLPRYLFPLVIFIIAFVAAGVSTQYWDLILRYWNRTDFQIVEPIYSKNLSFYFFQLPLYEGIQNWFLALLSSTLAVTVSLYILKGEIHQKYGWSNLIRGKSKNHLLVLVTAIALLIAVEFYLERYQLLYSDNGVVFGANYTDVHARIFALSVMSVISVLLAGIFLISLRRNTITLPGYAIATALIALVILEGVYPWVQQQFIVEPNELAKERPYIEYNIAFTQNAYDLNQITTKQYPAEVDLEPEDLVENQATLQNIRLWDYRPLLSTYRQLQEIRLYYRFNDVDIDRYTLNGDYRQVMLSPRELDYSEVPARAKTWVNQRLKYTHGYGLVMSPVNVVTPQGLPELIIKNVPPISLVDLEVERPGIYYGELTDNYIFTGNNTEEFDYPIGDENAYTKYDGQGGVSIPSFWQRLAYSYDLGNLKILISRYFTPDSRIHYYRQIQERVSQVAPFLSFDNDPYMVVIDGKLKWIVEGYTISDRYPYSEPISERDYVGKLMTGRATNLLNNELNYIRNSVKVVVDAYDGTMEFYVIDESDPILATYRKIFPNLFQASNTIPPEIRDHFRYPLNLFEIQAKMYLAYHMEDPEVFYNQEDLWRFATEIDEEEEQSVEPYYIIMRLPEGEEAEFVLILPFTPVNKDNMIAWMAARSDNEHYGKLLLYEFPKQELVFGPKQIEARIDQNPIISQQFTLWSQAGSRVLRGDILVIPLEGDLLYIEPVYLRAEQGELPELKRVIVVHDQQIIMAESLERALAIIFGDETEEVRSLLSPIAAPLTESALEAFQQAQEAAQNGNWTEYGRYSRELEEILQQLNREAN